MRISGIFKVAIVEMQLALESCKSTKNVVTEKPVTQ